MSFPFPVLWSGGTVWTEDSPAEANAEGDAYWHDDVSEGAPDSWPHTLATIDALFAEDDKVAAFWPLREVPGGTGAGAYATTVGTLDMDAVTSVNAEGDIAITGVTGAGVEFGTGEVSATNDGSIDWTGGWAVYLTYKPDVVSGSERILFSVAGTDGFRISVLSTGAVRVLNTTDSSDDQTDAGVVVAGETHAIMVEFLPVAVSGFAGNVIHITVDDYSYYFYTGYTGCAGQTNDTKIRIGEGADGAIAFVGVLVLDEATVTEVHHGYADVIEYGLTVGYGQPYWTDLDLTQTGKPTLKVAVDSMIVLDELQSANWRMGHKGWMSDLEPGNASLTFLGLLDAQPSDDVVIYCETGPLWAGYVDDVNSTRGRDMTWRTTVAAIDTIGRVGKTELLDYETSLAGEQEAAALIEDALSVYGQDASFDAAYDAGTGRTEFADYPFTGDLIGYVNRAATIGNLFIAQDRLGNLRYVSRGPFASGPRALPLVGVDSPGEWTERQSSSDVLNRFYSENESATVLLDERVAESERTFGVKTHEFAAPETWTGYDDGAYAGGLTDRMAEPRPVLDDGSFLILDLQQSALLTEPLDLVQHFQDVWVVQEVRHEVTPWEWRVHLAGERDNDFINGLDTTDGHTAPDNPSELTIDEQEIDADVDALVKLEGATAKGAGASNYLPVGRDGDGDRYRSAVKFSITWPTGFVRVQKATLRLQNSDQSLVERGAYPRVEAKRVTRDWTEGTEATPDAANAVVWGDLYGTETGSTVRHLGNRSDDAYVWLDVTDIAQHWHDSGVNYGVLLKAANEQRTRNATEFYSSDSSEDGPRLILRCVVE